MNPKSLHNGNGIIKETDKRMSTNENGTYESSDFYLWQEFKMGKESAFARIYKDNVARLYSYGIKLVNDKSLVKDSIQDLFVELWDAKEKLGDVKSIKSYLYKSIRRKLIAQASKKRKRFSDGHDLEVIHRETSSIEINLIEKQLFNDKRKKLVKTLNKLNDKQREIIHLKYFGNLSYDEISEIMSLDKKGTYNLMAHTIKLLRQHWVTISLMMLSFKF
ncbi:RNA polymerase sigma factor [Zobellia alginiliquefaciens]|uniref:RNA polymerase sigma factor n=1 Tax=Zobellia alginiliquefaciens TaxID=3032586 RepID=UPI0023E46B44|nr:sigma-70 family RNA polymerase sigma factor [Zobellia alginiliquefaciens]